MHPRMMLSTALAASTMAAFALAGGNVAPSISHAVGGGIEIPAARPSGAHPAAAAPGVTQSYSHNWSGYEQVGTKTKVFTAVMGTWTVPTVRTGSGDQYSSDWVGIDGAGNTTTLIQDGTDSDNIGGKAKYDAWTELVPAGEVVRPLVIKPGDEMEGLVQETATNKWALTLRDLTTGKSYTKTVTYITPQQDVEAIHERPCLKVPCSDVANLANLASTKNVTQLPDYYSTAPPGKTPVWTVLGKTVPGATLHQMFMTNNSGTKVIASPSTLNAAKDGFTVADGDKSPAPPPSWFATKTLLPSNVAANLSVNLSSIACLSASRCVAVGTYGQGNPGQLSDGLLLTGWGSSWTPAKAPLPSNGASGSLSSVACPSPSECVAVGTYTDSSGEHGLIVTGSGASWTAAEAPLPANAGTPASVTLTAVTCASPSACVVVGSYNTHGLLLTSSGSSWTAIKAPLPAGLPSGYVYLDSVACASASQCAAVGIYQENDVLGSQRALLLTGSGSSWTARKVPLPGNAAGGPYIGLDSIACASVSQCAAVGYYSDTSAGIDGLLLSGLGSKWAPAEARLPPGAAGSFNSENFHVACASAATCVTAMLYPESSDTIHGALLSGLGSSWITAKAPLPAGATGIPSYGSPAFPVACPSSNACIVAGDYLDPSGDAQPLVLTGIGSSWAATPVQLPADAAAGTVAGPDAVACASTTQCAAVGSYTSTSGQEEGLLLTGPG